MNYVVRLTISSVTLILALVINYFANTETIGKKSIGEMSRQYDTLITPAAYAFSIWGLIYLLLICFVVYLWYNWLTKRKTDVLQATWGWFSLANLANALWVIVWTNDYPGLSVLIMLVLLFSLIAIVAKLNMERWNAPLPLLAFVWWPFSIYTGWIILATVVNISAFLVSLGWEGGIFSPVTWTIIMIIVSTLIYVLLIFFRNMREAAIIGVWGFIAIAVQQWATHSEISWVAFICALILLGYTSYHAFLNRNTLPFIRDQE